MSNKKMMHVASILYIVFNVVSVLFLLGILNAPEEYTTVLENGETVLKDLALNYAITGFEIVSAIIGFILAGKKSSVTVVLGIALFCIQVYSNMQLETGIASFIVGVICFLPSTMYCTSAFRAYKGVDEAD